MRVQVPVALAWLFLSFLCSASRANASVSATVTTLSISASGIPVTSVPSQTIISLNASVLAGNSAVTTGQVVFCDATSLSCSDVHRLGLAQITAAGIATLEFVPGPGTHSYRAQFLGITTLSASTSAAGSLTVVAPGGPITTRVGILAAGTQGNYNLLGTVATNGLASPTGQVAFQDTTNANYLLGTGNLGPTGSNGITFFQSASIPLPQSYNQGALSYLAVGDFNGDGHPDFVVSTDGAPSLLVAIGNGDGTFQTSSLPLPTIISGVSPFGGSIVTGDFNDDGKIDIAVLLSGGCQIFLGNGDGTFTVGQLAAAKQLAEGYSSLIAADFNGDGQIDLAAPGDGGNITILLGNGDGTFVVTPQVIPIQPVFGSSSMVSTDFNGDGIPDLAVLSSLLTSPTASTFYLSLYLGNGDGTFQPAKTVISSGTAFTALAAADLNQDGKQDLIATNQSGQPITVLLGNGDSTFQTLAGGAATALDSSIVGVGDFNGDGIPDLVLPDPNGGETTVFLGNGHGAFVPDTFSPSVAGYYVYSLATADFAGTGQTDIAQAIYDDSGDLTIHDQVAVLLAQAPNTAAAYVSNISPVGTGDHYVDASYSGDVNNSPGISASVPLLALQVPTVLTLTALPSTSAVGQQVVLTASLDKFFAQNHYASGIVSFTGNGKALGTAPVNNSGIATLNVNTLVLGRNNLIANYTGDINFTASTSPALVDNVISTVPTVTTLTSAPNPAYQGQVVTFTAAVTSNTVPSGSVSFYDGATLLGRGTLNTSGQTTFTTSTLAVGTHPISAVFPLTSPFSASTSNTVQQVILASTFAITVDPLTIKANLQGATTVHLTSIGNFAGPLALTFGTLPTYSTATITPSTVNLTAGGTATATFNINTLLKAVNSPPQRPGSRAVPSIFAATGFLLLTFAITRRKRLARLLTLLAFAALFQTLTGCTNAYYLVHSVEPGTYQIPIIATDVNHNTQSATLTLTVTP
jgi:hypothetical protein